MTINRNAIATVLKHSLVFVVLRRELNEPHEKQNVPFRSSLFKTSISFDGTILAGSIRAGRGATLRQNRHLRPFKEDAVPIYKHKYKCTYKCPRVRAYSNDRQVARMHNPAVRMTAPIRNCVPYLIDERWIEIECVFFSFVNEGARVSSFVITRIESGSLT